MVALWLFSVTAYTFGVHWAVNVTVPDVERRFLNEVALVLLMLVAVVVALPYVCVTPSMPLIFQPANVYPVRVGLLIVSVVLYVADVGAELPAVPPFNVYDIEYVFAVHLAYIVELDENVVVFPLLIVPAAAIICVPLLYFVVQNPPNVYPVSFGIVTDDIDVVAPLLLYQPVLYFRYTVVGDTFVVADVPDVAVLDV